VAQDFAVSEVRASRANVRTSAGAEQLNLVTASRHLFERRVAFDSFNYCDLAQASLCVCFVCADL
jgi:hypothetical protein